MNKVNYNELFTSVIKNINISNKPKLLLQCCCAPCSTAVLERVLQYFSVTLYFYNPNIMQEDEFYFREKELIKLVNELNNKINNKKGNKEEKFNIENLNCNENVNEIALITTKFNATKFLEISKGYENEKEGETRCKGCYVLRLKETALFAKKNNFDYFCSTLSVSPYKNANVLNEIGYQLEKMIGVKYLPNDFKKNNGFLRSVELSKYFGLYRQNYCGCDYSKQTTSAK